MPFDAATTSPSLPESTGETPPLSIVIPTHNEEENICRLLELIAAENYPCEIIVSNSGSTDETAKLVQSYIQNHPDLDIKLVESQLGVSNARNDGATAASNKLVLFFDADVNFAKGFIQAAVEDFQQRALDAAGFDLEPDEDSSLDRLIIKFHEKIQGILQHAPGFAVCTGVAMLADKQFHQDQIGGFDPQIDVFEDVDWARKASKKGKFGIIKQKVQFNMDRFRRNGKIRFALNHIRQAASMLFFGKPSPPMLEEYRHTRTGEKIPKARALDKRRK